ncbi:PREDICTED: elongation factor Ts, mitochondrial [Haliaeetus leucocephalus]|uniref:elongation factor Ts, mitochondrial n=1 Tax=Haliaeetus leucocephalus TaxID=52644 RepID=UPI00053CE126|nr:PREDICTED: elongation factor Ts, mitochondrial [Haliaeetus leucocephalus]
MTKATMTSDTINRDIGDRDTGVSRVSRARDTMAKAAMTSDIGDRDTGVSRDTGARDTVAKDNWAWLEEQAQRQGWSKATEVGGRRTPEGLVGLLREGTAAVMVEVNCETDFVARNAEFQRLVEQVALGTMAHCRAAATLPASCSKHLLQPDELAQLRTESGGALLSNHLALAIGKLGENLTLRRAAWLRVPEEDGYIAAYAHGWLPVQAPVAMGTYGALVACQVTEPRPSVTVLEEVGRKVAQHVVGMAPTAVGTPQDEPQGEAETRLLAQSFLLEPALTVGQFLAARGALAVRDFLRFRCGEETPAQEG